MNRIYKAALLFGSYFVFLQFGIIWFLDPESHQHVLTDIILAIFGGATSAAVYYWMMKLMSGLKARKAGKA